MIQESEFISVLSQEERAKTGEKNELRVLAVTSFLLPVKLSVTEEGRKKKKKTGGTTTTKKKSKERHKMKEEK